MAVCINVCPRYNQVLRKEAESLGLPVVSDIACSSDEWTLYDRDGVLTLTGLLVDQPFELNFDWFSSQMNYRRLHGGGRKEALAKAVGLKTVSGQSPPRVIDATAGMGRESFLLANLGYNVLGLERQPSIYLLLKDALAQAAKQGAESSINTPSQSFSLKFELCNSIEYLSRPDVAGSAEVVYLDPMFPERQKSAAVKKDMRIFKRIAGEDPDADALLYAAKLAASKRVVVKRPSYAGFLNDEKPSHQIVSKKHRFDVYSQFATTEILKDI